MPATRKQAPHTSELEFVSSLLRSVVQTSLHHPEGLPGFVLSVSSFFLPSRRSAKRSSPLMMSQAITIPTTMLEILIVLHLNHHLWPPIYYARTRIMGVASHLC